MDTNDKIKFTQILKNNPTQSILLETDDDMGLENVIPLSAVIPERELHIPTRWHQKVLMKGTQEKVYLLIENIDKISKNEQEKFVPLLKDKRAGNFKLPTNVQIIISAHSLADVSENIKKHTLYIEG